MVWDPLITNVAICNRLAFVVVNPFSITVELGTARHAKVSGNNGTLRFDRRALWQSLGGSRQGARVRYLPLWVSSEYHLESLSRNDGDRVWG